MQLRQDLGREDGWRNGFRQPRWQDSSHGRRQLVRHPGGRGAPGNEVAFLVTSGANFCGYGSGAEFAGGESFAQRPEGGPPQGAAASCPVSARVDTRGGPHTSSWERMPKLVGNPRFNWTDPRIRRSGLFLSSLPVGNPRFNWTDPRIRRSGLFLSSLLVGNPRFNWTDPRIRRSGLFLSVQTANLLAGARLIGVTCFDWTDPGIRRSGLSPGVPLPGAPKMSGRTASP